MFLGIVPVFGGCTIFSPVPYNPFHLPICQDPEERKKLVAGLHLLKTDIFMELVQGGAMPLRPGVQRLVRESSVWRRGHVGRKWERGP